ncbi:MAG: LmeA family phospholipid-binding protein [Armatimonadetes bacterium]|nr:LmeA family phospholipid-binding protein [Armatimonadota bacterium]
MTHGMQIKSLAALGLELTLPNGLTLDRVEIETGEASGTFPPFHLKLDKPLDFKVWVSAESVATFLEKKGIGGLKDVRVTCEGGKVSVEASARVIVEVRATAVCTLRIVEGTKLFVDLESVSVPIAKNIIEGQLAKSNPILDLEEFEFDLQMISVEVADGHVQIHGTADMAQSP